MSNLNPIRFIAVTPEQQAIADQYIDQIKSTICLAQADEAAIRRKMVDMSGPLPLTQSALRRLDQWYRHWDRDMAMHPHGQLTCLHPDTEIEPDPYKIEYCGGGRSRIIIASTLGKTYDLDSFAQLLWLPYPIPGGLYTRSAPLPWIDSTMSKDECRAAGKLESKAKAQNRIHQWLFQVCHETNQAELISA
ncbi:MAG: hypothetical protein Q9180_004107 [Flavoplaca navasiana]